MVSRLLEAFESFDAWLFTIITNQMASPIARSFFNEFTVLGSVIVTIAISVVLWFSGRRREAILLMIGLAVASVFVTPVKVAFPRLRPFEVIDGLDVAYLGEGSSFPSGHASRGILLATLFGRGRRKRRIAVWLVGALIAFSRVYIGVHWPTDVVFGGIIGWVSGLITLWVGGPILRRLPASWITKNRNLMDPR